MLAAFYAADPGSILAQNNVLFTRNLNLDLSRNIRLIIINPQKSISLKFIFLMLIIGCLHFKFNFFPLNFTIEFYLFGCLFKLAPSLCWCYSVH